MSFVREMTVCHHGSNSAAMPTEQELGLSRLVRPGMAGGRRIERILLPGKYAYISSENSQYHLVDPAMLDVTEVRKHSIRAPRLVRMEMAFWQRYQKLAWAAFLASTVPEIIVPVHEADDATLGYYNCRLLKLGDVISLNHRSIITDFAYRDDYFSSYVMDVLGSSLIEQHAFAHVNTPCNLHSGHLVIGKVDPDDRVLELTAFAVKPGDSVYIPAGTIHTNDYLLGTWKTLLSSACEFPSARVRQPGDKPIRFIIGNNQ